MDIELQNCPEISEGLLKHLQDLFPDKLPQCKMGEYIPETSIMRLIGHQDVISYLVNEYRLQNEKEDIEDV